MKAILLTLAVMVAGCASAPPPKPKMAPKPAEPKMTRSVIQQHVQIQQIIIGSDGKPVGQYYIRERRMIIQRKVDLTKEQIAAARAKRERERGLR